ncbi:MAG: type II toxin-antitoxin system RelE/ParE family toxin [Patescibacteria group bacterium]
MLELVYTPHAVRDIKKLDHVVQKKLRKALEKLQTNPLGLSKKLASSDLGEYRYRFGNYRIIFDLDKAKKRVVILKIGHRREVYQ